MRPNLNNVPVESTPCSRLYRTSLRRCPGWHSARRARGRTRARRRQRARAPPCRTGPTPERARRLPRLALKKAAWPRTRAKATGVNEWDLTPNTQERDLPNPSVRDTQEQRSPPHGGDCWFALELLVRDRNYAVRKKATHRAIEAREAPAIEVVRVERDVPRRQHTRRKLLRLNIDLQIPPREARVCCK